MYRVAYTGGGTIRVYGVDTTQGASPCGTRINDDTTAIYRTREALLLWMQEAMATLDIIPVGTFVAGVGVLHKDVFACLSVKREVPIVRTYSCYILSYPNEDPPVCIE